MSIGKLPMVRRGRKILRSRQGQSMLLSENNQKSITKPGGTLFERKHFYESRGSSQGVGRFQILCLQNRTAAQCRIEKPWVSDHIRQSKPEILSGKTLLRRKRKEGRLMSVYKEEKTNTWRVIYRYTDWTGQRKQSQKRGFKTKREAQAWEREQMNKATADLDMTFESFIKLYTQDMQGRIKENTWHTKENIINTKLLPYFKKRKISQITPKDIINWQNEMINYRDVKGKPYSPVYLKTLHNQLSAIFNHAVKYYGLRENPAAKVGNMGKSKSREMLFWTKEEYLKFAEVMMDKPIAYYAFEVLYWCGIREGELLALTTADFDFTKGTVSITKSYQRINGRDIITPPKTEKSNRIIKMPKFLCEEMQDYLKSLYGIEPDERIFPITKNYLHREMDRGSAQAGVKRIRIHDLRHSHVSLLIEMGFSAVAIADRVGHESIDITFNYAHLFPSRQTEMADKLDMERTQEGA